MDTSLDAFSTPGITRPAAFDHLRADLHRAADPRRIAEHRTLDAVAELRERADFFRNTMECFRGQGLGYWYAEMALRFDQMADEIAGTATANGIIGGAS